jgi:hypothetical protein
MAFIGKAIEWVKSLFGFGQKPHTVATVTTPAPKAEAPVTTLPPQPKKSKSRAKGKKD